MSQPKPPPGPMRSHTISRPSVQGVGLSAHTSRGLLGRMRGAREWWSVFMKTREGSMGAIMLSAFLFTVALHWPLIKPACQQLPALCVRDWHLLRERCSHEQELDEYRTRYIAHKRRRELRARGESAVSRGEGAEQQTGSQGADSVGDSLVGAGASFAQSPSHPS